MTSNYKEWEIRISLYYSHLWIAFYIYRTSRGGARFTATELLLPSYFPFILPLLLTCLSTSLNPFIRLHLYLRVNYSRYWYADFFIRFRVSRLFQRSIWRQSERICDVKLTFNDVILTISRNYPWPVMLSSLYRSLMSWNHVSINYSGTVADIDLPFFLWHSARQRGSDEPKYELLGTGSQEEKAAQTNRQTDTPNLYI